jgi:hypothetical protein
MPAKFGFFTVPDVTAGRAAFRWTWERADEEGTRTAKGFFDTFEDAIADAKQNGFSEDDLPRGQTAKDLIDSSRMLKKF